MKIPKSPLFQFFLPTGIGFAFGYILHFTDLASYLPIEWMLWPEMPAMMVSAGLQGGLTLLILLCVFQWTLLGLCIGTCWLLFGKAVGVQWHVWVKRILLGLAFPVILVSIVSFLYFGVYNPNRWDHVPAPNIAPGAMTRDRKSVV